MMRFGNLGSLFLRQGLRVGMFSLLRRSVALVSSRCAISAWVLCMVWGFGVAVETANFSAVEAAKIEDWQTLASLLRQGVDVNESQADGATALHWAAHWNNLEALESLIVAGANVNAENDYGATPLWVACANRHTNVVERLLRADANPNRGLRSGETLLMRCTYTGDPVSVRALLEHGADVRAEEPSRGQTALMWSAASRHPDVTRLLLQHGAEVDARTKVVQQLRGSGLRSTTSPAGSAYFNAGGFTPLLFAARHGDIDSAKLLLEAGADVNEFTGDGNSGLVLAAMGGHGRFSEFLLDRGADPDASFAGYTALHAAVLRSDIGLVKALLGKGANPDIPLTRGTPIPRWTYQMVFTLKDKGATPFMLAAKFLEPEIMRALAAAGADPLLPMDNGSTVLMAAVGLGSSQDVDRRSRLIAPELIIAEWEDEGRVLDSVKAAIEAGAAAFINETNQSGDTVLHAAADNGFETVVEYLVASGADVDIRNEDGKTARELLDSLSDGAWIRNERGLLARR